MKKILLLLLLCTAGANAQIFHVYMSNGTITPNMVVAFSDSTTDDVDVCCDAVDLGGVFPYGDIWSNIGSQAYVINSYGPLTGVRVLPIGAYSPSAEISWTFSIPIVPINTTVRILDGEEEHDLPYTTAGDFYTGRFSLVFSPSPGFYHVPACTDTGRTCVDITIPGGYDYWRIIKDGATEDLYTGTDSTVCGLTRGDYSIQLYRSDLVDGALFTIDWVDLSAELQIPWTTISIQDPSIIPEAEVFTPYDSLRWEFGDGRVILNDYNPVHTYGEDGVYTLTLTVYRGHCSLVFTREITVYQINSLPPVYIRQQGSEKRIYGIDGRLIKISK